jgi:hypothetical protein
MEAQRQKNQRLTAQQIAFIQRCEGSLRSVAKRLGVGKSTVDYHRQKVYDAWSAQESDDSDDGPKIAFEQLSKPRRCPTHGLVRVWPCVQCSSTNRY